ncbi:hypothetical protein [Picrophilus oshimae]|uniref:Uncharacterized protein n=1 Tax=Picrophilus torridus (strain ATCC 700027 / DSM 9790 / JCM 10055 / NBRC 100828 / KAW 2/3) TaxID=1122961 RepID=A0A8G2L6Q4_PICTO|nr:hypothetical protein [Picrophilus oshimae]SMD30175.1 hypothetical protein SAMN02745355_0037 [Picrophilus oshimae DSM 9789]
MYVNNIIDIIKGSMLYGDVENAYKMILKGRSIAEKNRNQAQIKLFRCMELMIRGEIGIDDFIKSLKDLNIRSIKYVENKNEYIDSIINVFLYSISRYNIRYPEYINKRIDP